MALSSEDRYGIEMDIEFAREYQEKKKAHTVNLSERIDFFDGIFDALDSAEFALEYCNTTTEYLDELKNIHERDFYSWQELRNTDNHKDANYYHGSTYALKSLISHAELMLI